jgi:hypothetical protein
MPRGSQRRVLFVSVVERTYLCETVTVEWLKTGRSPAGPIQDEQLVFQENRFCNDGTHTSGASNSDDGNNDVEKNQHQVANWRMLTDERISYCRRDYEFARDKQEPRAFEEMG